MAIMLPTASAAEKTTPITVSVDIRVRARFHRMQPAHPAPAPPLPRPRVEPEHHREPDARQRHVRRASDASAIRRITANASTRPAAAAMATASVRVSRLRVMCGGRAGESPPRCRKPGPAFPA